MERWWVRQFSSHLSNHNRPLRVTGPCVVFGGGRFEIGERIIIRSQRHNRVEISIAPTAQLYIGDDSFLNQGVRIACSKEIRIGKRCAIGDESVILDNDYHGMARNEPKIAPIEIQDDVWLGTRVIVLRGVTIGEGSVIGAGAVVTHSVPAHTFAAGVPARVIRTISPEK